jgi:hypothetical protein
MFIEKINAHDDYLIKLLFPKFDQFISQQKNSQSSFSTLFYCYKINICGYVNEIASKLYNETDIKKNYFHETNHFYSTKSYYIIDCNDFYGRILMEFIIEYTENLCVLNKKHLFILHNYEQLDPETQYKIASKIDRTINSAVFWITCKNISKLSRKLYNKINIVTIPVPNFHNMKLYLNKFLNKMNLKMFEPVLDKIIQISDGDLYKAVFYIEIFQIDRNIINRNLLDNDIDKIINFITDKSFIEKEYHQMRELAFNCLEKTDMINIIFKLLNKVISSNIFSNFQKKKIITHIAEIQKKEKPNCKGIYILEAILSKIIIIYYNSDNNNLIEDYDEYSCISSENKHNTISI